MPSSVVTQIVTHTGVAQGRRWAPRRAVIVPRGISGAEFLTVNYRQATWPASSSQRADADRSDVADPRRLSGQSQWGNRTLQGRSATARCRTPARREPMAGLARQSARTEARAGESTMRGSLLRCWSSSAIDCGQDAQAAATIPLNSSAVPRPAWIWRVAGMADRASAGSEGRGWRWTCDRSLTWPILGTEIAVSQPKGPLVSNMQCADWQQSHWPLGPSAGWSAQPERPQPYRRIRSATTTTTLLGMAGAGHLIAATACLEFERR